MSLLTCSVCGHDVKIYGKRGAVLHTSCTYCGADSAPMITAEENKISKDNSVRIEIIKRPKYKKASGM